MEPTRSQSNASASQPASGAAKGSDKSVDLVEDAKGLAGKVADEARGLVGGQVTQQQERSAGELGKVARALRDKNLTDTFAGPYAEKAAAFLDRMSGSVRNATLADTVRTTESFARREPLLFLGGAFAIGLLAARFLKSSTPSSDDDDDGDGDGQRMLPPGRDDQMYSSGRPYRRSGATGSTAGMAGSSGNMGATGSSGGDTGSMTGAGRGAASTPGSPGGRPARGTGPQGRRGGDGVD